MNKKKLAVPFFSLLLTAALCGCAGDTGAGGRIGVFAGLPPAGWLAGRIGGEQVSITVLVDQGQSAHSFEPTPRQAADLARARLYLSSGLPFEETLAARAGQSFPGLEVVDLRRGLTLLPMQEPLLEDEASGGHDSHGHAAGEPDPHFWLDPGMMKTAAATVCEALCRARPGSAAYFRENLARAQSDLDALDSRLGTLLAPHRGRTVYVFHPAFGYFTARYGLVQAAIEAGGREPSARELARLTDRLRADRAGTVFIQRQFAVSAAASLQRSLGVSLVELDPQPADYLTALEETGRKIAASFEAVSGMN